MPLLKTIKLFWYILEYCLESIWYRLWGSEDRDEEDVRGKVVVITGGIAGVGKSLAMKMADRGATVVLGCRNMFKGKLAQDDISFETKNRKVHLYRLDLEDFVSVREFATTVTQQFPEISILINNAEICCESKEKSPNGFEKHMCVNHFGHFLLTNLLLPNIKRGAPSRIVAVSSSTMLLSDLDIDDMMLEKHANIKEKGLFSNVFYNNSKMANCLFVKELGRQLQEGSGVTTYSVCPGLSKAKIFFGKNPWEKILAKISSAFVGLSDSQAAESIMYCILSRKCEHETGKFYRFEKVCLSGNRRLKTEYAKKFFDASDKTLNIYFSKETC